MKRRFFYAVAMVMAACALGLVSCGDDKDELKPAISDNSDNSDNSEEVEKVEYTYSTPEAVDLGLSVKWANFNLGASKPEEFGYYYGWGCTEPYADTDSVCWELYFRMLGGKGTSLEDCGTSLDPLQEYEYPNLKSIGATKWDAARQNLGGKWRMPTSDELGEMVGLCDCTRTTMNGVSGMKVTNKSDTSKYIFFPAAGSRYGLSHSSEEIGCYWSSDPYEFGIGGAYYRYFIADRWDTYYFYRDDGFSIRPVMDY